MSKIIFVVELEREYGFKWERYETFSGTSEECGKWFTKILKKYKKTTPEIRISPRGWIRK